MERHRNPQAEQMACESMLRTLSFQAQAIWPQEVEILRAACESLEPSAILDVGCGSGEIVERLATLWPHANLLGVDVEPALLAVARERTRALGDRVRLEHRDAFDLRLPDEHFDLVVCRHVLQAIPEPERALGEMLRVTRPGGRVHLLVEDYGMIHFPALRLDSDDFWRRGPVSFGAAVGTDMRAGRSAAPLLQGLGAEDVRVDYVVVDTQRVPREVFAGILRAWRDGYVDVLARHTTLSQAIGAEHFEQMIDVVEDPGGYAVWMVPVIGARKGLATEDERR